MNFAKIKFTNKNFKKIIIFFISIIAGIFFVSNRKPNIKNTMLDGEKIKGISIAQPKGKYLISYAIENPTEEQKNTPVLITGHGYSATIFEWIEFKQWKKNNNKNDFYISNVLLNGHGENYEIFKKSTWKSWQKSLTDEYERLVKKGFKNISFVGASTSGSLILELFASGYFKDKKIKPKNIFTVDAIVIPTKKILYWIDFLGPLLQFSDTKQNREYDKYWYHFRPYQTLKELKNLIRQVENDLKKGIKITRGTSFTIYKSKIDGTVNPISAKLMYENLEIFPENNVEMKMIDSKFHVYTRLALRKNITERDRKNRDNTFEDIYNKLIN